MGNTLYMWEFMENGVSYQEELRQSRPHEVRESS